MAMQMHEGSLGHSRFRWNALKSEDSKQAREEWQRGCTIRVHFTALPTDLDPLPENVVSIFAVVPVSYRHE